MDKLKQYLEQHRADMDVDLPPANSWQVIRAGSQQKGRSNMIPVMRYAAAALFILVSGALWLHTNRKQPPQAGLTGIKEAPSRYTTPPRHPGPDSQIPPPPLQPKDFAGPQTNPSPKKTHRYRVRALSADVVKIDRGYTKLVAYQLNRLRTTPVYVESPAYFTAFASQLAQMDKDEQDIKDDMRRFGMDDQLLESLIDIYQQKLNLLKTLQKEIRQMNSTVEDKSNRKEPRPYYLHL